MSNKAKLIIEVDADTGARQIEKVARAQDKVTRAVKDSGKAATDTGKVAESTTGSLMRMAGTAVSVGAITSAMSRLADQIIRVSKAANTANDAIMGMVAMGASPTDARSAVKFMATQGVSDISQVAIAHKTALAVGGTDKSMQQRLLQEQADLLNLGVDAEGTAAVIAMGVGRGLTPEQASAVLVQSQKRSRLSPGELARVIAESEGDPRNAAAVGAALSQTVTGRKAVPAAGVVLDVLEGRVKENTLSGTGLKAWREFMRNRGVYDELMSQPLDERATDNALAEIMADPSLGETKTLQAQRAVNLADRRTGMSAQYAQSVERRALRRGGALARAGLGFALNDDGTAPYGAALEVAADFTRGGGDPLAINRNLAVLEGILNVVGRVADNTSPAKGSASGLTLGGGHGGTQ